MPARLKISSSRFVAVSDKVVPAEPPRITGTLHRRAGPARAARAAMPGEAHAPDAVKAAPDAVKAAPDPVKAAPDPVPAAPMRQAYRDLARGLQDTDRSAEVGRTYRKLKR